MSLKLLYGSALQKKSEVLYNNLIEASMKHPGRNYILIVPEQASLMAQEALVKMHPRHALSNIDVLTFNRLAYRVFSETGEPNREALSDIAKIMVLRLVTLQEEKNLEILGRSIHKIGVLDELKSVISELAQYAVSPEMLRTEAEKLGEYPALRKKLSDIARIYEAFLNEVHEDREIAEERPARLAAALPKWKKAAETTFAFDGFTGFTPPQYKVLKELLHETPEMLFTVTVGTGEALSDHKAEEDLFHMSRVMAEKLKEMAISGGIPYTEETVADEYDVCAEIRHLERHIYRCHEKPFEEETDRVTIVRASRTRDEIAYALHAIMQSVRAGDRFRDSAVICGDLENGREEIEEQFRGAGIPCFIDERRRVREDCLIRLIESALEAGEKGFEAGAVFAFSKNPLVLLRLPKIEGDPLRGFERISELERFVQGRGIRGRKAYADIWRGRLKNISEDRIPFINQTKDLVFKSLLAFDEAFRSAGSVREKTAAIRGLLREIDAEDKLKYLADQAGEKRKYRLAAEYGSIFGTLDGLLLDFERLFGDKDLDRDLFTEVLEAGLHAIVMAHVPPTRDRVVVGDLRRTRLPRVKHLFILDCNEGVLPANHSDGGLLNENDREILKNTRLSLAETATEEVFNDRFYLYLLMTRSSARLNVVYKTSGKSKQGKAEALFPSEIVRTIRTLFPNAAERETADGAFPLLNDAESAKDLLSRDLRSWHDIETGRETQRSVNEDEMHALWGWLSARDEAACQKLVDNVFYQHRDPALTAEEAKELYGETISGSVSRLQSFAECPYKHFLNYGLGIKENEIHEIERADMGSIYHGALDRFFKKTRQEGKDWWALSSEETAAFIELSVQEAADEIKNGLLVSSARNRAMAERVKRVTDRTVKALRNHWEKGHFRDVRTEIGFGEGQEDVLHFLLEPDGTLSIRGTIDRLDTAENADARFVKIIDYKSSDQDLHYNDIEYGTKLQLPLYLYAAMKLEEKTHPEKRIVPAGIYYYFIDDPLAESVSTQEEAERTILGKLQMKGISNADETVFRMIDDSDSGAVVYAKARAGRKALSTDEFAALSEKAKDKCVELAEGILSGDIAVRPVEGAGKDGCRFCKYAAICGIQNRGDVPGYQEKTVKSVTKESLLNGGEACRTGQKNN